MIFMPIPRRLLPHEISYDEYLKEGRHSDAVYEDSKAVRFVRLQPKSALKSNSILKLIEFDYLLFIDVTNSMPAIKPVIKSKVVFDGDVFLVKAVEPLWVDTRLHHYEVQLVKG